MNIFKRNIVRRYSGIGGAIMLACIGVWLVAVATSAETMGGRAPSFYLGGISLILAGILAVVSFVYTDGSRTIRG